MTIASCVVTLTAVIVIYFTHVTSCSSSKISIYFGGILEAVVTAIDLRPYSDWWLQFISACLKQCRGDWDLFPHILSCREVLSTLHTKF